MTADDRRDVADAGTEHGEDREDEDQRHVEAARASTSIRWVDFG
jgi:hypothetical protein